MEPKKTLKADLTRKTFLFFNIGMVTALLISILAFTHKTKVKFNPTDLDDNGRAIDDVELIAPTVHMTPPPPRIQLPVIQEVDNDENIEDEPDIDVDLEPDLSNQPT